MLHLEQPQYRTKVVQPGYHGPQSKEDQPGYVHQQQKFLPQDAHKGVIHQE